MQIINRREYSRAYNVGDVSVDIFRDQNLVKELAQRNMQSYKHKWFYQRYIQCVRETTM